jgi:NAD(P)-dependent dehydrogenase (short-subunit alcohol dehydrogenase family)
MEKILITGANRGIGLAMTRLYAEQDVRVFATARKLQEATALQELANTHKNLTLLELEVADDASIAQMALAISQQTDTLDLLINNAGMNGTPGTRGLETITRDALNDMINVNATSALMVTGALLPLLLKSTHARVVMISSQMGSLTYVQHSVNYGYTMSKAAMNMASRVLNAELSAKGITTITVHPGWVKTDMGGENGELAPEESATLMLKLFNSLTLADSGKFYKWNGEIHAW